MIIIFKIRGIAFVCFEYQRYNEVTKQQRGKEAKFSGQHHVLCYFATLQLCNSATLNVIFVAKFKNHGT